MYKFSMIFVVMVSFLSTLASANDGELPPVGIWSDAHHDGATIQWIVAPREMPNANLSFISYIDHQGDRVNYFLIRRECDSGGRMEFYVARPSEELGGLGRDCFGRISVSRLAKVAMQSVNPLPKEAADLILN